MLTLGAHTGKGQTVQLQSRLVLVELLQRLIVHLHHLGHFKGGGAAQGDHQGGYLAGHGLVSGFTGILIILALCIVGNGTELIGDSLIQLQKLIQRGSALAQASGIGGQLGDLGLHRVKGLLPCLVGDKQVVGVPGVLNGNFTALGDFSCHRDYLLLKMLDSS